MSQDILKAMSDLHSNVSFGGGGKGGNGGSKTTTTAAKPQTLLGPTSSKVVCGAISGLAVAGTTAVVTAATKSSKAGLAAGGGMSVASYDACISATTSPVTGVSGNPMGDHW